jgi:hypothetical protein
MLKLTLACLVLLTGALCAGGVAAGAHRSHQQRTAFMRLHPCPATGRTRGACPGYVVDHVRPLCAGGPDAPQNMQWQTTAAGKAKDRIEREECRHHAHAR